MTSGQVVCQCPNGEILASDGVNCVGKSVFATVIENLHCKHELLYRCAACLSGSTYTYFIQTSMNVQMENMIVNRSVSTHLDPTCVSAKLATS